MKRVTCETSETKATYSETLGVLMLIRIGRAQNGSVNDRELRFFFISFHSINNSVFFCQPTLSNYVCAWHVIIVWGCTLYNGKNVCVHKLKLKKKKKTESKKKRKNTHSLKCWKIHGIWLMYFLFRLSSHWWLALPWGQFTNLRAKKCFCSIWIHGFTFVLAAIIENNYRCV